MITDPIGDFLTRVRNAQQRRKEYVEVPSTRMLVGISDILKKEGFVADYEVDKDDVQDTLRVYLKYVNDEPAIRGLVRVSRPGVRKYRGYREIEPVKNGLGVAIFTTPNGVVTGDDAVKNKVGGEYLCDIF